MTLMGCLGHKTSIQINFHRGSNLLRLCWVHVIRFIFLCCCSNVFHKIDTVLTSDNKNTISSLSLISSYWSAIVVSCWQPGSREVVNFVSHTVLPVHAFINCQLNCIQEHLYNMVVNSIVSHYKDGPPPPLPHPPPWRS